VNEFQEVLLRLRTRPVARTSLETILKYLANPMDTGVYIHKSIIDFSGVHAYLSGLSTAQEKAQEGKKVTSTHFLEARADRLKAALEELGEQVSFEEEKYFEVLTETLRHLHRMPE